MSIFFKGNQLWTKLRCESRLSAISSGFLECRPKCPEDLAIIMMHQEPFLRLHDGSRESWNDTRQNRGLQEGFYFLGTLCSPC